MPSAIASGLDIPAAKEATTSRRLTKAQQREELDRMGEVMIREEGLLNAAQTAIVLDRSRERVYELIELGILNPFEFLGRIYLSFREVRARRDADVKAGRPVRTLGQGIKAGLQVAAASDGGQWKVGGITPYAAKQLAKKKAKRKKK